MTDSLDRGRLSSTGAKASALRLETEEGEEQDPPFKPLTRQEVQALRARYPATSPWAVLGVQALIGLALSAAVWVVWRQSSAAWSALYGAATVVIPGAVMARGMSSGLSKGLSREAGKSPGDAVIGFMVWEFAKVGLAVAMLAAAVKVVPGLNWPALLITMIVSMKVNWLVLLWRRPSIQKHAREEIQQHVR